MSPYAWFNGFVKLTAWPVQWLCFRTKYVFEDRKRQGRRVSGPAIIVSNHTSVYDYAVLLFAFPFRTLRCQMAEVLFEKQPLGLFLRLMGGIRIDRAAHDFTGLAESERLLRAGGAVEIFPEGRLPRPGETPPLPFRPGAAWLALTTGAPVIPVYTDGSYFRRKRAHLVIGAPMTFAGPADRERMAEVSREMSARVMALRGLIDES